MSRFAAVHLPPDRALNGKVSMTLLKHYAACPRSGYLYALYKGEASTREMVRGSALHAILSRAVDLATAQGESYVPGEVVKVLVDEVLAEMPVPVEEHDYVREMAYRWASETMIEPASVIANETLLVLDMGGYEVRGRVDFAELLEGGAVVHVPDYKSSRAAPAFEEISRKRPDDTRAAKAMQLILYALLLVYGVPVRVEECEGCDVTGWEPLYVIDGGQRIPQSALEPEHTIHDSDVTSCSACGGRGYVEVREPFPLASRAQRVDLEFVFPGIEGRDGLMLRRPVSLTRLELDEYRASFEGLLSRLAESERTGDWPAVVSDAACGECPAPALCPIPSELRDHRGTINSVEEASEAAEVLDRRAATDRAIRAEIKAFCKAEGIDLRFGRDKVFEFVPSQSEEIRDKDAMWAAIERATEYGEPFERSRFVRVKQGTNFKVRTLTADELAAEAAGEEVQDG